MTGREQEILALIEGNPLITQAELAKKVGITRASVAVHISNLLKKGHIIGKGYVLSEKKYITVIGGANIDIAGIPFGNLKENDSNPGLITFSLGGVGRNIAENLGRLNQNVEFITVLGDDIYGEEIRKNSKNCGISLKHSITAEKESTSTYLFVLDEKKEMKVAISAMNIYDKIDKNYIKKKKKVLENATICVVDTNIPIETLEYIAKEIKTPVYVDCVSTIKAEKIKKFIGDFYGVKANKFEAETISGIEIKNYDDLEKVGDFFLKKGVKELYISLGEEGVFFCNESIKKKINGIKTKVGNVTGAGDAFMAGIGYSKMERLEEIESCKNGIAAATIAVESLKTISEKMCIEELEKVKSKIN